MYKSLISYLLFTASLTFFPTMTYASEEIAVNSDFLSGVIQLTEQGKSPAIAETVALLKELSHKKVVLRTGTDAELRPAFVGAQLDIERYITLLLRTGKIESAIGFIHTPTPATPLCKEISEE